VHIVIAGNGSEIPAHIAPRLFEPYLTPKPEKRDLAFSCLGELSPGTAANWFFEPPTESRLVLISSPEMGISARRLHPSAEHQIRRSHVVSWSRRYDLPSSQS
jgi:hypothetical protein